MTSVTMSRKKELFFVMFYLIKMCLVLFQHKITTSQVRAYTLHSFSPSFITARNGYIRPQSSMVAMSMSMLNRQEGESKDEFFKRITAAASDPKAFEQFVASDGDIEPTRAIGGEKNKGRIIHAVNDDSSSSSNKTVTGYVRAEEWDRQLQEKKKNMKNLSWEERVQFDGQRYGDQFNQNEILRHNLKGL